MHKINFIKKKDGSFEIAGNIRLVSVYRDALIRYMSAFCPLFEKAKETCEFEFILTLLNVKGIESAGWDVYASTEKTFLSIIKLIFKIRKFETKRNLLLWLYGHIVEASQPYETVANLININNGGRYKISNFPDKISGNYRKPQSVSNKIRKLEKMAKEINMQENLSPFIDIFDRDLRNAIFHSDYSLYGGEVRIKNPVKSYSNEQITDLFNKSMAYFIVFSNLLKNHIRSYCKPPKVIPVHPEFGHFPDEKAITIIRKGHGLAGIKDNWTMDELKRGHIPFRIGRFSRYELKMLDKDSLLTVLPYDRRKIVNSILVFLPNILRKFIVKRVEKFCA